MFGKLLVALDGTDVAQTILPFASQLAMGLDVPLVLFSAVQGGGQTEEESYGDLYEKDAQAARSRLNELCEELSAQGVNTQIALAVGSPAEQIVAAANERGCGLIAMSTHGRNIFARGILGSVTSKVIHDTDTPVLTITPEKAELYRDHQIKLTRIMVPLDGSPLGEIVLPYVEELALRLSLTVSLARVVTPPNLFWMDSYPASIMEAEKAMQREAGDYLETVAQRLGRRGLEVETRVLVGHPAATLIDYLNGTPHDIIAMATHARTGISRRMLGSVTDALVRGSGDPVIVFTPPRDE